MMVNMKAVCIIPAFNEEKNIEEVVRRIKKVKSINDVIVIDDGSKDKTAEIAKNAGAIVLRHKINKGKGETLKTGFNYILKKPDIKYIIVMDADLQFRPEESEKLLKLLKNGKAEFVIGYRNFKKMPFRHLMGNLLWKNTFNFLFKTSFKDTNCGYFAILKDIIEVLEVKKGYVLENSILASVVKNKIKFKQVNVSISYKKVSKFPRGVRIVLGVFLFILKEGLKYRLRMS
jgi:glycosyltransferase involved in cell wall biosynthesis